MAHRLLRLTKRSYQRPGGAGTSSGWLDQSTRTLRRLGSMAKQRASGRATPQIHVTRFDQMKIFVLIMLLAFSVQGQNRPRAREAGIQTGILPVGPHNAITDVTGVMVGHTTVIRGDNVRTGVTAILPHGGNLFREKVPGA
ncbi:MAG TPA: P1 family peptidase, partial [Pyrinomonadaceae bacterium]|nr:P1 family peptidase [Pyrinomonadaceae bacterium]